MAPHVYSGSLFTNSNWFAFEDDRAANERSTASAASPSPNTEETSVVKWASNDEVIPKEDADVADTATSEMPEPKPSLDNSLFEDISEELNETGVGVADKPSEWVEWRESSDSIEPSSPNRPPVLPNGEPEPELEVAHSAGDVGPDKVDHSPSTTDGTGNSVAGGSSELNSSNVSSNPSQASESGNASNPSLDASDEKKPTVTEGSSGDVEDEEKTNAGN